ncbi:MAG: hypothetical protein M1812_002810 [Candelaria pacifica]|nr:MAG: hypothetical protein M1812_002810 [Candelaria pacifica]
MNDPSGGVPPALLPHIHLLSTYQYPVLHHVSIDTVVEYLLSAQRITRELAAMSWTYLDTPSDGSVLLVWQPLAQLGTNFASDGYVWADPETAFNSPVRGYTVEMYIHRSGFRPGSENVATHCRRRYRLTSKDANTNGPPPDPSLWIIHYSQADPQNRIPANRIQVPREVQTTLSARRYLHSQGQLVQKQFMLHDRDSWPTVNLPGGQSAASYAQQTSLYPGNTPAQMGRPQQQQPYFQQQQQAAMSGSIGPSPAKRPRQTPPNHTAGASSAIAAAAAVAAATHESSIDDEEDTSRGDMLDHLTPREISTMRYAQHHEWMEEVISSPYGINQILPVDLGFGLKGELESLTEGFFVAPTIDNGKGSRDPNRAGKMEDGKAEEFTKRATEKVAELSAEMEKMKRRHARRMEKLNRGKLVVEGERRLRSAISDPNSTGTEIWRLEGREDDAGDAGDGVVTASAETAREQMDNIVADIEGIVGKRVNVTKAVVCVQTGGLEEKTVQPAENTNQTNYSMNGSVNGNMPDAEMDMGNSATGLLDQYRASSTSTPGAYLSTPQPAPLQSHPSNPPSQGGTPAPPTQVQSSTHTPDPTPNYQQAGSQSLEGMTESQLPAIDMDVNMSGVSTSIDPAPTDAEANDWVMVPKNETLEPPSLPTASTSLPHSPLTQHTLDPPTAFVNTANNKLQNLTPNTTTAPIEQSSLEANINDNNTITNADFGDFANINTAGEELADFGAGDVNLDADAELGLDGSAFGDAFHGTEMHGGGGGGGGEEGGS